MQSSQSSGEPRVLRCPQCGAPLEAPPFALTTRCGYCGHSVKLAEPSAPQPTHPAPAAGRSRRAPILILVASVAALGLGAALVASIGKRPTPESAKPTSQAAIPASEPAAASPTRSRPPPEKTDDVRYPMRSLLGVRTAVDIDGSSAHMLELFPTVRSKRRADELQYTVPLSHPWFDRAELGWKNERTGKLTSVSFKPPAGDDKFKNQKEIGDCLAKGLGKPEVREIDHLAGEQSYFWGKHFPKAWANLYSGYLWLTFQNPEGLAPVTLATVVRTLDACTPPTSH